MKNQPSSQPTNSSHDEHQQMSNIIYDVVVIGAGIVGCAVARRFTLEGAHVAVIEKATDILDGASKGNSAILHTGFDATPGSLELACIIDGYREYIDIHEQMGLPLQNTGAHVVAWNDEELSSLAAILDQAHGNGVSDAKLIDGAELSHHEPHLSKQALGAIHVPGESIIDPWSAPYSYLRQSLQNGGEVFLSCEVTGGSHEGDKWQLETTRGTLNARHVINCAGLYGDLVNKAVLGSASFDITPRKGQFVVYDKAALKLINSIILPVPTSRTKGIVVFPTVFGNLVVGPTAEDQQSRSDASTNEQALEALIASGISKIPALENMPVTATYAGLRPATQFKDYQIDVDETRNWTTVGGIRSTGLSGALGIAQHVFKLTSGSFGKHSHIENPKIPQAPALAQLGCRDWRLEDHGDIICHCELVTEREINMALKGALKARSLQGLKRQTRVTMGRCQGFYCSARLAQMTQGHFASPIAKGELDD